MKKQLLLGAFLLASFLTVKAQVLQSDDFSGLTPGNLTTDFAGTDPGQANFYLQSANGTAPTTSTNAGASNAMVVSDNGGNTSILITGPNGDKGSRFLWKNGLPAAWAARTTGNNIIELEFDINPGGASTSRNTLGMYIYNADFTRVLAGVHVRAATREISLVAYATPTGQAVGNYNFSLAAAPGIQIPADTWSRLGVSYNKTTGQVRIKGPGIAPAGLTLTGSSPGTDPAEINIVSFSGHTTAAPNTVSSQMGLDNIVARASATDTLLGLDDVATSTSSFSVFPNPANDVININNADGILVNGVEIVDLNGRTVKSVKFEGVSETQINVSDLSAGMYMMTISSDKGAVTKKIVKQ